jgi:hypothetical protein
MKIKPTFNKENISDVLELSGRTFTVNGKSFDLDNLSSAPESVTNEEEIATNQAEIDQFNIDNPVRIENGKEFFHLSVAMNRRFIYINNNYKLVHDKNMDGEFDQAEFEDFIRCYNLEEPARQAEHEEFTISVATSKAPAEIKETIIKCMTDIKFYGRHRETQEPHIVAWLKENNLFSTSLRDEILLCVDRWVLRRINCGQLKELGRLYKKAVEERLGITAE